MQTHAFQAIILSSYLISINFNLIKVVVEILRDIPFPSCLISIKFISFAPPLQRKKWYSSIQVCQVLSDTNAISVLLLHFQQIILEILTNIAWNVQCVHEFSYSILFKLFHCVLGSSNPFTRNLVLWIKSGTLICVCYICVHHYSVILRGLLDFSGNCKE